MPAKRNPGFVAKLAPTCLFVFQIACRSTFAGNYVVAWNGAGLLSVPAAATNVQAIAAGGGVSLALTGNGTVFA